MKVQTVNTAFIALRKDVQAYLECLEARAADVKLPAWHDEARYQDEVHKERKVSFGLERCGRCTREEPHVLEVVTTDADHGGCRETRKSLTSYQVYLDGNLIESKVRSQKSIALSSGESEFVAIFGGASEASFMKQIAEFLLEEVAQIRSKSDSPAARAMCNLRVQEKVQSRQMEVGPIPTMINPADIGTKALGVARMLALMFLFSMVDECDQEVGREQYEEVEAKMNVQKHVRRVTGGFKKFNMAAVIALCTMMGAKATSVDGSATDIWLEWMIFNTVVMNILGALGMATGYGLVGFDEVAHENRDTTSTTAIDG